MKQIPELLAWLDESPKDVNLWHVWCAHCLTWHTHGGGGKGDDPMRFLGNRVAHCYIAGSPYDDTGYDLVYGGRWKDLTAEQRRYGLDGKEVYRQMKSRRK